MLSPDDIRLILPWLIGLPILTAVILCIVQTSETLTRRLAIGSSLLHLALTGLVAYSASDKLAQRPVSSTPPPSIRNQVFVPEFVPGDKENTHKTKWTVAPFPTKDNKSKSGIQFYLGLDGFNLWLVVLSSVMMLPIVLISVDSVKDRVGSYFGWLFVLQGCITGVFLSFDIILFYIFFELTLVPLYFLIGSWGSGPTRREASRKLFLFTLAGGLITLLGIANVVLTVYNKTSGILTFSIPELAEHIQQQLQVTKNSKSDFDFWMSKETFLFMTLVVGFAVKIPLVPLHSWLPGAYTQAPIGVTVMLSALLAKMGTFGLLRICMPLAPDATLTMGLPILGAFAAIGIIYGAFCAYAQSDFKSLVAYSSISHLGFCVLGLLAFNSQGIAGGTLHMVNHGLSTGAMFLLIGYLTHRYASQQIHDFSGIWAKLPVFTFFMMFMCLASVGLPGLNNFVSEMMMLCGLFDLRNASVTSIAFAVVGAAGIFLGAWYTITLLYRSFFGPLREPTPIQLGGVSDLSTREWCGIAPLAMLCLVLGLFPQPVLDTMKRDVDTLARIADEARERAKNPPLEISLKPNP